MPDDLKGIGGCVSPGVSDNCGFDTHIADLGIDIILQTQRFLARPCRMIDLHFQSCISTLLIQVRQSQSMTSASVYHTMVI